MNAEEARRLNHEYAAKQQLDEKSIDGKIREAAAQGKARIAIDLSGIDLGYRDKVVETIKVSLVKRGFEVRRTKWRGGGESYDNLVVSW